MIAPSARRPLELKSASLSSRRRLAIRTGLTLIEVMLALTIMLLAMGAIVHLVGIGAENSLLARMTNRGSRLAQAKMAEVEAGVVSLQNAGGSGTFDSDPEWSYTIDSQQVGPPNVYQVTVTVSHTIGGKPFEVTLSQMIFDPSMMGSSSQAEEPTTTDVQTAQTNTTAVESGSLSGSGTGTGTTTGAGGTSP